MALLGLPSGNLIFPFKNKTVLFLKSNLNGANSTSSRYTLMKLLYLPARDKSSFSGRYNCKMIPGLIRKSYIIKINTTFVFLFPFKLARKVKNIKINLVNI